MNFKKNIKKIKKRNLIIYISEYNKPDALDIANIIYTWKIPDNIWPR